ncbi:SAM-dependent DNA methylase domain-containing protein [Desulfonema limicola]|uniref:SAM-dependent DNA methylase domain-containing protein n=1 Tax=Desulfonema limicola TaxID=45656 RepID=A0A975BF28_9BACT|nr:DNA methyltransferase [Desulfonema limicola]QTA83979.1 SAM-dependent DNA methylase domain-containing protein [Desulfonema limicola]
MDLYIQNSIPFDFSGQNLIDKSPAIDNVFDIKFANTIAKLESYNKHLYRPNTYLHKWWARRCGSTFRLILKHLVENPALRDYYLPGGLEGKIILDPMMGGGTTLHEAVRMGANVIGIDIDPIPVLQAKATLSHIPFKDIIDAFNKFYNSLCSNLAHYFITNCPACSQKSEIQFILYGLKRSCSCKSAIFADSIILRYESDGTTTKICPYCHDIYKDEICNCGQTTSGIIILEKSVTSCPDCGQAFCEDYEIPFYSRYTPLAVCGFCQEHGQFFKKPSALDMEKINISNTNRPDFNSGSDDFFKINSGPKSDDLIRRKIFSYLDLFSSRQLIYLQNAIDLLSDIDPLIKLNLALLVSTSLEFNCMLCGYKGGSRLRPGAVRHTFSHHAYSFPYTALENNMLFPGKTSGTLQSLFNARIRRGREWAVRPKERMPGKAKPKTVFLDGEIDAGTEVKTYKALNKGIRQFFIIQGSSASINIKSNFVDFIVTDPPYFDSVQYSDLAAFFRVWLHMFLPENADWDYDAAASAVEHNDNGHYGEILGSIFKECSRVLKKEGRLVFTFHHWNPKGWAALTIALKNAGFFLVNRYAVHSENPISVHIANLKSLKDDAILVLTLLQSESIPKWKIPKTIDKTNSQRFCEDCASILGWMLSSDMNEESIKDKWNELLKTA